MKSFLEKLNAFLLLLMFAVTLLQIVARVILKESSVWSEELARFLFVWIVFVGAAALVRDENHIRITVLTGRLPPGACRALRILTQIAMIPFVVVFTWGAYLNMVYNWGVRAPTIDWMRFGYVYLGLFWSGLIMLWYVTANLLKEVLRSWFGHEGNFKTRR